MRGWLVAALGSAAALVVVSAASCDDAASGSTSGLMGTGGTGGTGTGAGAEGGFTGETITVEVVTEDAISMAPIPGVEICVEDVGLPCVTSDSNGQAVVEIPANARVWATLVLDGYVSALIGAETGSEPLDLEAPMINNQLAMTLASVANTTFDTARGHLGLVAVRYPAPGTSSNPPQPGVTFAVAPDSGDGPIYAGPGNIPDPNLTETGDVGGAVWFNVSPGEPVLTGQHPTEPCAGLLAHSGDAPDTYDLRVREGFVTFVTLICGEEPMGTGGGGMGGAGGMGMGGS